MPQQIIMQKSDIAAVISKLTEEVLQNHPQVNELAIVGVRKRGDILAERVAKKIKSITKIGLPVGILDISFYRDDIGVNPQKGIVQKTDMNFDVTNKIIILVDDVLFTGRSARAAIDAIIDFGRPKQIQLLVLIDRGHREFPFYADYIGKKIDTKINDKILVKLKEIDGVDEVLIETE